MEHRLEFVTELVALEKFLSFGLVDIAATVSVHHLEVLFNLLVGGLSPADIFDHLPEEFEGLVFLELTRTICIVLCPDFFDLLPVLSLNFGFVS